MTDDNASDDSSGIESPSAESESESESESVEKEEVDDNEEDQDDSDDSDGDNDDDDDKDDSDEEEEEEEEEEQDVPDPLRIPPPTFKIPRQGDDDDGEDYELWQIRLPVTIDPSSLDGLSCKVNTKSTQEGGKPVLHFSFEGEEYGLVPGNAAESERFRTLVADEKSDKDRLVPIAQPFHRQLNVMPMKVVKDIVDTQVAPRPEVAVKPVDPVRIAYTPVAQVKTLKRRWMPPGVPLSVIGSSRTKDKTTDSNKAEKDPFFQSPMKTKADTSLSSTPAPEPTTTTTTTKKKRKTNKGPHNDGTPTPPNGNIVSPKGKKKGKSPKKNGTKVHNGTSPMKKGKGKDMKDVASPSSTASSKKKKATPQTPKNGTKSRKPGSKSATKTKDTPKKKKTKQKHKLKD